MDLVLSIFGSILSILIGSLIYVVKNLSKKIVDLNFDKKLEKFKSELQESLLKTQASYDYKQFAIRESFYITIKTYKNIFILNRTYQKLWNSDLSIEQKNKHLKKIVLIKNELMANQILLDEEIYVKLFELFGSFHYLALNQMGDGVPVDKDEIKNLKPKIADITNLIRSKFGLKDLGSDFVGIMDEVE